VGKIAADGKRVTRAILILYEKLFYNLKGVITEEYMELHVKNIGPINSINLDIEKDLTFIYGINNIGKSYAITLLYLFLKNYAFNVPYFMYQYDYFPRVRFNSKDASKAILEKISNYSKDGDLDITEIINQYIAKFMDSVFTVEFSNSLHSSFGDISNLKNKMSNEQFEIHLRFKDFDLYISEKNNRLETKYTGRNGGYILRRTPRRRNPHIEKRRIVLYFSSEEQFIDDLQEHVIEIYRSSIAEVTSKINNVYYLPASRSGLYRALNAFSQILAELATKRTFLHEKIVLPSISEQDSDYFSRINEINIKRINQKFSRIASKIEKKLLNGEVSFDQKTKRILFHPRDVDIDLELLGTSSMIAEVSPIVIYLRYIIGLDESPGRRRGTGAKPIIFIEEPEAHLHPEAQVDLIECFVDLIKSGAKLVITSHSNYIFNKLNNLIAMNRIDKNFVNGYLLYPTKKGSRSKNIPINDLGMEDGNFIDIAEKLYNEKLLIIDSLGEK
jgi:predicted ATPase